MVEQMIRKEIEDRKYKMRKCNHIILSEVMYSQLRREILGIDKSLENLGTHISEYMGIPITRLDRDDSLILVG